MYAMIVQLAHRCLKKPKICSAKKSANRSRDRGSRVEEDSGHEMQSERGVVELL